MTLPMDDNCSDTLGSLTKSSIVWSNNRMYASVVVLIIGPLNDSLIISMLMS